MRLVLAFLCLAFAATVAHAQSLYRLQPGDTIEVSVFQEPDLGREVLIGPDGRISFPLVGHVKASGRTVEGVEGAIKDGLKSYFQDELDVTVLLIATKEVLQPEDEEFLPTIYVTGEVQNPGAFEVKTRTSVLQAIALSGGLSPYAAKHRIIVRRVFKGEEVIYPFDYAAAESGWPAYGDITLRHGDVIVVPERGLLE